MNLQEDQAYESILIWEFYRRKKMACTDTSPWEMRVGNIIVHLDQLYALFHSFSTQWRVKNKMHSVWEKASFIVTWLMEKWKVYTYWFKTLRKNYF